jgi:hypothetical protein
VFASDRKNYLTLGPQGEVVEVKGAKWRGSDREGIWTKFPSEFLRRLTVEGLDAAIEFAREIKQRIENGNGWEWVTRTHRVSGADKTLLAAGFCEGELASYTYKRFGSNRREISRSPEEGYDIHHYTNLIARVVGEIAEVCGFALPEDLRVVKKRRSKASMVEETDEGGEQKVKLEDATEFLRAVLERGPVLVEEILAKAAERGISRRTLFRAREHLGVRAHRSGGRWWWRLPDGVGSSEPQDSPSSPVPGVPVEPAAPQVEDAHGGWGAPEEPEAMELVEGLPLRPKMDSDVVEERAESSELLGAPNGQGDAVDTQGAPEEGHGGSPTAGAEARDLVRNLARTSLGPHHLVNGWTLGLCPSCGRRSLAWRYQPPEAVAVCDCSVAPGLVRADRLPVEPVTIR